MKYLSTEILLNATLSEVKAALAGGFIVTDSNVFSLYKDRLPLENAFVIPAGEASKSFKTLQRLLEAMLKSGLKRASTVCALGGGVVGDLAGFAASVYMRGVRLVQIPTTLLAMCDSSIGGKTAVNLRAKNMVGTFYQPERILICKDFLQTLPPREMLCGTGEIVKTALLCRELFDIIESGALETSLNRAIELCAATKAKIVEADEREAGLRKRLNLGHTLGHALEAAGGFALSHGEYVMQGLMLESRLFKGSINPRLYNALQQILQEKTHLPQFVPSTLTRLAGHDKKNTKEIAFVVARDVEDIFEAGLSRAALSRKLKELT